ncbi:MAG: TIGR02452 family protein [Dorea sp.]|nr:TIGR02452 family protein [Dorea sp.]
MGRNENITIFQDTEKLCKTNDMLIHAVKYSSKNQRLIFESKEVTASANAPKKYEAPALLPVSKRRTLEAASQYKGQKTAVLNFASATNPGGGVIKGSDAQEEAICRCSSLYFSLNERAMWDGFYSPHRAAKNPLHNDDCIYTPDVIVFKSDTANPELLPLKDWYKVNVITCAAPNLRERPGNSMNPGKGNTPARLTDRDLLAIHEKRLRRILDIAAAEENEVVILGAFGCGAFLNPPRIVARAMKNVVKERRHDFKVIEFAVYCPPRDDSNYKMFERIMNF